MDLDLLRRIIEQLRGSGLFFDVGNYLATNTSSDAVKLTLTIERQGDAHVAITVLKALITGFFLLLPSPFIYYDYDLIAHMSLEATTSTGQMRQYSSQSEGTASAAIDVLDKAIEELAEQVRARLVEEIVNQMVRDEALFALRPKMESPPTGADLPASQTPAQPLPSKVLPSPSEPLPPPIY
jgi:hypothetical protein